MVFQNPIRTHHDSASGNIPGYHGVGTHSCTSADHHLAENLAARAKINSVVHGGHVFNVKVPPPQSDLVANDNFFAQLHMRPHHDSLGMGEKG